MGVFDDLLAEAGYSTETPGISPVGQAIATGSALPSYGTPRMTPFEAQTYQTMTPLEGALMTPATFGQLPAEQRSAIELESELRRQQLLEAAQPSLATRLADPSAAFLMNLGDTAALGFGSELASALEAPFTSEKTYGDLIREAGTAKERLFETNPLASIGGTITGAALPIFLGGGLAGAAATQGRLAPTLAEQVVAGTTTADILNAAKAAKDTINLAKLAELTKIGALQGAITGAGAAEPTVGEDVQTGLTKRAIGAGLGTALGAAAPSVISGGLAAGKGAISLVTDFKNTLGNVAEKFGLREMSKLQANAAIADVAEGAGITEAGLRAAKEQVDASGNPLLKQLTTDELVPTPGVQALREVAQSKSEAGREGFWAQEQQQIGRVMLELDKITDNIDMTDPAAARAAQDKAQRYVRLRAQELAKEGNKKYEALPDNIEFSRNAIREKLADVYDRVFAPGRGKVSESIQYAFDYINKRMFQEGGKLSRRMFGKAEAAPTTISARELIDLRSGLLAAGRDLAERNPEQARLANQLAREVHDFIKTDPRIADKFGEANKFWDDYIDTFHSKQFATTRDPDIISPENLNAHITANVSAWKKWTKQTGGNPKLFKEQLAIAFQRFREAGVDEKTIGAQIKAKAKALDDLKKLVENSPVAPQLKKTYELARATLDNVEAFLTRAKEAKEMLPSYTEALLKQSDISEYAAIAATNNPKAAGAGRKAFDAALRQFARDKLRQGLSKGLMATGGLGLVGAGLYGGFGGSPISVGATAGAAGLLAAAGFRSGAVMSRNAQLLNETLVSALRSPERMLQAFASRDALQAAPKSGIISALSTTGKGKATTRGATTLGAALAGEAADTYGGKKEQKATPTPAATPTPIGFEDLLKEAEQYTAKAPASEAEPKRTPSTIEKVANALVTSAASEEPKKKSAFPVLSDDKLAKVAKGYAMSRAKQKEILAKHYTPADVEKAASKHDRLTRAQIAVESNFNQAVISKAGAIGAMQIMPKTAQAFKINPFNLDDNIKAGKAYREKLTDRFKDYRLALMAYNWGEGNVSKSLKWLKSKDIKPTYENVIRYATVLKVPKEAKQYAAKVQKAYNKLGE